MNVFIQNDINEMISDIKYLLKMVRSKRYHYDLNISCDIYNNIISLIGNIYDLIVKYDPNSLHTLSQELNDKDTALDLMELVTASPIENLYKYKQLGLLEPVYNLINYILTNDDKSIYERLSNRYDYNYVSVGGDIKYNVFALYCISEVYNLNGILAYNNSYNIQEAQNIIFNESINIINMYSKTYPIFTKKYHNGKLDYDSLINNIWNLIYYNKLNGNFNCKAFFELTDTNYINDDRPYDFYMTFANMSRKMLEYILSLIGPAHANIIITMAKLRYINHHYSSSYKFYKIYPMQDWSRLLC